MGADLTAAELRYLIQYEWAQTEDDVLWRRSKLGLRFTRPERARLATFMAVSSAPARRRNSYASGFSRLLGHDPRHQRSADRRIWHIETD